MGRFVDFHCRFCHYAETHVGVGRGRDEFPILKLYLCDNCNSFGSTWIHKDRLPVCSICYHDVVRILDDDVRRVTCPRCGETALITPADGVWE